MVDPKVARFCLAKRFWLFFLGAAFVAAAFVAAPVRAGASPWDELLQSYVDDQGGVDYAGLAQPAAHQKLTEFLGWHATLKLESLSEDSRKALYINLYNAMMIASLLRYAQEKGITPGSAEFLALEINAIKVPGGNIWGGDYKTALGPALVNLDEIEHQLLRGKATQEPLAKFKIAKLDPRIHAVVNCAAVSCPKLRNKALTADNLDAMLNTAMADFVNSTYQFNLINDKTMQANKIVKWYYDDFASHDVAKKGKAGDYLASFVASDQRKIAHLRNHFNDLGTISLNLTSHFDFFYNWLVNDKTNRKKFPI